MKEKLTIALATGDIRDDYSNLFSKGAMKAADVLGIRLVIVPGRYFHLSKKENIENCEYQFQTLFNYISAKSVDGAIICSDVIGLSVDSGSRSDVNLFLKRLEKTPVLSVSKTLPGLPVIKYNNTTGFYDGISYMIEKTGAKKIAMIAGPQGNMDSCERVETYKKALSDHHIKLSNKLIINGDFTQRVVGQFEKFMIENPDVDGVVFANDKMAIACYDVVMKLGRKVGSDIYFLGFDDEVDCLSQNPALASVSADAAHLGYESVVKIYDMINKNDFSDKILKSDFVVRDSIINKDRIIAENHDNTSFNVDFFAKKTFTMFCSETIDNKRKKLLFGIYSEIIKKIYDFAFNNNEDISDNDIYFILSEFVDLDTKNYINLIQFAHVIENLNNQIHLLVTDENGRISNMFVGLLDRVVKKLGARNSEKEYKVKHFQHGLYQLSSAMFSFSTGRDDEYVNIASRLNLMGINNCYFYLFKDSVDSLITDVEVKFPECVYLKASGKTSNPKCLSVRKQKTKIEDIFYKAFEDDDSLKHLVAINIFFGKTLYGVLLCDIPYDFFRYYEIIIYQVSSACRMINLLKNYDNTRMKLEESIKLIQENYSLLETISNNDPLTGLLNRRGFMAGFDELLAKKESFEYLVCSYVDLDGLKVINDNYGHDDGDFAINSCAEILQKLVAPYESILSRIGGDEFAFILLTNDADIEKVLKKKSESAINRFNKKITKPYKIDMSMGIEICNCDANVVLSDILDEADNKLYRIKKMKHLKQLS